MRAERRLVSQSHSLRRRVGLWVPAAERCLHVRGYRESALRGPRGPRHDHLGDDHVDHVYTVSGPMLLLLLLVLFNDDIRDDDDDQRMYQPRLQMALGYYRVGEYEQSVPD